MGLFKHEVKNVFLLRLSIRELYGSATCQVGLLEGCQLDAKTHIKEEM